MTRDERAGGDLSCVPGPVIVRAVALLVQCGDGEGENR